MRLEGRRERRLTKALAVNLLIGDESRVADQGITVNVSAHGARLKTQRKWNPGEQPRFVTDSRECCGEARVVYCQALPDRRFCVGLEIRRGIMDWG
jgi:PilZ domain